jgi:ATP-binding cassette, subfamily C, bacterial CydD
VSGVDRELLRASRPARLHLAMAVALGAGAAVLTVLQAALLAHIITAAFLEGAAPEELSGALVALAAVGVGRGLVSAGFEVAGRVGAARVMSGLRRRLVEHMPRARAGELAATAVQGVDALEEYFARYLPQVVLAGLVPVAVLGYVATLDPPVAAILAVTLPLIVLFMVLIGRGAAASARSRWRALSALAVHFLDVVEGLETLRAHVREEAQAATLARVGDRLRRETMATLRIGFLSALVLELLAMLGTALAAVTIGMQLINGSIGLEAGLTALLLAPELYLPLRRVGSLFHAAADGVAAARTLLEAIAAPAEPVAPAAGRVAPARDPRVAPVRFEHVMFTYPGRHVPAVGGVDLELERGRMLALVGPSGAGKSTLAALLLGLLAPDSGRLTCGGVDLAIVDPRAWRARLGWLPQHPTMFAGSVADNVRLADPDATRREVWSALRAAHADRVVAALPSGLDTAVGEGGRMLSAGEAQRITLARALLRDAPLLVLDEPTAHLDADSAAAVGEAVVQASRARTTLLITHRGSLAAAADRVTELRDARIAAVDRPVRTAA